MKTFMMKQGTTEWLAARCGYPSACEFHRILPPGEGTPFHVVCDGEEVSNHRSREAAEKELAKRSKKGGNFSIIERTELGTGWKKYAAQLVSDMDSQIPPEGCDNYTNNAIRWGAETEAEARRWYTMETGNQVQQVGGCLSDDGRFWCSPDGLVGPIFENGEIVGTEGGIELFCPQGETQAELLLEEPLIVPPQKLVQVHGALVVTGAKWWDALSYSPGLRPILVRTEPNEFTQKLRKALNNFYPKFQAAIKRIRGEAA